ncbi:IclR family transcriptional regulator [Micromonospora sp. SH-82]|uniref:IclR family transcriptional regulator n=1 Tax=Micromonospora sp. SH-82 TaxID=3132938 RepID=UPI003EB88084
MTDRRIVDGSDGKSGNVARNLLVRSLAIIEFVTAAATPPRFSSIARATRIPKSTLHRLLGALIEAELMVRFGDAYGVGERLTGLRPVVTEPLAPQVRHVLLPHLVKLHHATGLVSYLGVLDLDAVAVCDAVYTLGQETVAPLRGGRLPAHCTAVGKILLAYDARLVERFEELPELPASTPYSVSDGRILRQELLRIRATGTAWADQEWRLGIREAAAPVFGPTTRPLAGLALLWRDSTPGHDPNLLQALRQAAFAASLALRRALAGELGHPS